MNLEYDPNTYGATVAALLSSDGRLPSLGPGSPVEEVRSALEKLTPESVLGGSKPVDRPMAEACISGLWLHFDFLDESHTISQSISSSTGSYWHGIMHRREPDPDNSKYWFRKVGRHAVFDSLADAARELADAVEQIEQASWLKRVENWDPMAFIDLCDSCYRSNSPDEALCRRVQLAEWRLLFDYCHRLAKGM